MIQLRQLASRRPRRFLAVFTLTTLVVAQLVPGLAYAVHDLAMQLDGDVSAITTTSNGGTTQAIDWDSLFDSTGTPKAKPAGFTATGFDRDFIANSNGSFNTSDQTTFSTGSKDTLPISGWQCNFDNNVNSKIDVMNAYAAAYLNSDGDQIIYFALERNANTGDANVGFWFLQDEVGCVSTGPSQTFSGNHQDGDLLIVSAFTKGGGVSTIDVYRWNGGANGSLGATSVAHGADCKTTAGGDDVCATTNTGALPINGTISTPWPTSNKQDGVGTTLREAEFFEGGLNLTNTNLGGKCFNVFIGDTRSSQSLTATLFDFARGKLGECSSSTTTTPSVSGSAQIPTSGTLSVTDSATLTVTGVSTWSGTYDFHLCFLGTDTTSTDTCTSGGTLVSSQSVNQGTAQPITSGAATVTSAGRYCWRGDFTSATSGVPNAKDDTAGECFNVTPRTPTLATQAGPGPVDFGNPVTDTATIGNTANQPGTPVINPIAAGGKAGGTITFFLYGPDQCTTLASGFPAAGITVSVSGDGTYGPVQYTPTAPGQYNWVANYSGDLPNTLAQNGAACGTDPNEAVTVRQIPTEISTAQKTYPQDSATITSSVAGDNLPSGGTVIFRLYGAAGANTALQNCQAQGDTLGTGGLVYKQTITGVGGSHSVTVNTNNSTFSVDASTNGTYYWRVTYATGDTAHTGRQSNCLENVVLTFADDSGPGTVFP